MYTVLLLIIAVTVGAIGGFLVGRKWSITPKG